MSIDCLFTDAELRQILDEATLYMCACPAQVASHILSLRRLFTYQEQCVAQFGDRYGVHAQIAQAIHTTHATWETCVEEILTREGWDRTTLIMPPGLRLLQEQEITSD